MRLTFYSDYSLRLLMYAAVRHGELVTIQEVADAYGISKNHLMKVAFELGRKGYLDTVRGRGGGFQNPGIAVRGVPSGAGGIQRRNGDLLCEFGRRAL